MSCDSVLDGMKICHWEEHIKHIDRPRFPSMCVLFEVRATLPVTTRESEKIIEYVEMLEQSSRYVACCLDYQ